MAGWYPFKSDIFKKFWDQIRIFISPAGALITGICFFLPWLEVSCVNRKITGAGIGSIAWGIPVLSLIIFLVFIYFYYNRELKKSRPYIITTAIVGLIIIGIITVKFKQQIGTKYPDRSLQDLGIHIRFGIMGTIGGLLASLLGALFLNDRAVPGSVVVDTEIQGEEKIPDGSEETINPENEK